MKKLKYLIIFTLICPIVFATPSDQPHQTLKVLQFNIWQEGTSVPGGFEAIANEVIASKADLVAFSEVRNYHGKNFHKRIIEALKKQGHLFYGQRSYDTSIISRYPFLSYESFYPCVKDQGSITKAVVKVGKTEIAFYSAHLDYHHCSYYEVRAYSGENWKALKKPVTNVKKLLRKGAISKRDEAIRAFIIDARKETKLNRFVVIAGDFNEPSSLDWTEANKNFFDHHGVVINWECSSLLLNAGLIDSFRKIYPNPIKAPGFTFPAFNKDVSIKRLTWAPKSDERERIDMIYYLSHPAFKLKDSVVIGPNKDVSHSRPVPTIDKIIVPQQIWPSDHKALLSVFELTN
jgi:endonuclease/exonuclease/phosphatase family metal-dependent hydrolase